jgi:hypothetical protein
MVVIESYDHENKELRDLIKSFNKEKQDMKNELKERIDI